jgi:predicted N-acetyltransferase YhbS
MSFLQKVEAASFIWTKTKVKEGIRIAIRKKGFVNPDSAGTKDEVGYIHVVPNTFMGKGWYSVLNVEVDKQFQNQGLGKELYRRAAKEIKKLGGKGIVSLAEERTPEATRLWKSLKEARKEHGVWVLS